MELRDNIPQSPAPKAPNKIKPIYNEPTGETRPECVYLIARIYIASRDFILPQESKKERISIYIASKELVMCRVAEAL